MKHLRFALSLLVLGALAAGFLWRQPLKDSFLTVNGGFVRWALQKKFCNRVYLIDEDMGYIPIEGDFPESALNQVVKADRHAKRYGVKFLYVQGPDKVSMDRSSLAGVFSTNQNYDNSDRMLLELNKSDVSVFDVRTAVCPTSEAVRRNYMLTDTHWNYDGVLCAFQGLVPVICSQLGKDVGPCTNRLDGAVWSRKDFPRKVLGSVGRRVGPWFLPPEEFHYYVPDFKNTYTIRGKRPWEKVERKVKGGFKDVFVFDKLLNDPPSVYRDSPYDIIGGGNWDWLEVHNEDAPCETKILVVTDSYGRALTAFLSTVFSHLRFVDYRTYRQRTIKNEIRAWHPKLVVVFASGRVMQNKAFWNFYVEKSYK